MMEKVAERIDPQVRPPVCSDFDDDCDSIVDKVHCWLYDPAKGRCPYLSISATQEPSK